MRRGETKNETYDQRSDTKRCFWNDIHMSMRDEANVIRNFLHISQKQTKKFNKDDEKKSQ